MGLTTSAPVDAADQFTQRIAVMDRRIADLERAAGIGSRHLSGAGAPGAVGPDGQTYWDTTNDRLWISNGAAWVLLSATGTWTPTLTNMAIGTGGGAALSGSYAYNRGDLAIDVFAALGTSGASVSGVVGVSTPSGFTASLVGSVMKSNIAVGLYSGSGAFFNVGMCTQTTSTRFDTYAENSASTYVSRTSLSATVPGTWAAGDAIQWRGNIKGTMV